VGVSYHVDYHEKTNLLISLRLISLITNGLPLEGNGRTDTPPN
jgi:hypothetical protein